MDFPTFCPGNSPSDCSARPSESRNRPSRSSANRTSGALATTACRRASAARNASCARRLSVMSLNSSSTTVWSASSTRVARVSATRAVPSPALSVASNVVALSWSTICAYHGSSRVHTAGSWSAASESPARSLSERPNSRAALSFARTMRRDAGSSMSSAFALRSNRRR